MRSAGDPNIGRRAILAAGSAQLYHRRRHSPPGFAPGLPHPESGVLPVTPRGTEKPFVFRFRTVRWGTTLHILITSSDTGSMELRGLEPLTSWVRSRRSPS